MEFTVDDIGEEKLEQKENKRQHSSSFSGGFNIAQSQKRDSGYLTDNSPATFSPHSHFTFDNLPTSQEELAGAVGGSDSDVLDTFSPIDIILGDENNDEMDDSAFLDNPSPNDSESQLTQNSLAVERYRPRSGAFLNFLPPAPPLSSTVYQRAVPIPMKLPGGQRIRPLVRRTIGTQTPHLHCQLIRQVISEPIYLPAQARGTACNRLRHYSEGEDSPGGSAQHGPLPDIIPISRDRSVSLPDVQALRQQREIEVGRELRRISDEFHFSYHRRRRLPAVEENFDGEASSFPGARRMYFRGWWENLREFFSGPLYPEPRPKPQGDSEDPFGPS